MILNYNMFLESIKPITNTNIDVMYEQTLKQLPEIKELSNKFRFGNDTNCVKPITDKEINLDNDIKQKAKEIFDGIFGTDYKSMNDTDIINSIDYNTIYSYDIIKGLLMHSYEKDIYSTLKIKNDSLYKTLISYYIKSEVKMNTDGIKNELMSFLFLNKKMMYKKKYIHDFLLKYGNEFKYENIKDVFELKSKHTYELGGNKNIMPDDIQMVLLKAIKNTLHKFNDIMYFDKFKQEFFISLSNEMSDIEFKSIVDKLITKLNLEFIEKIKAAF